MTKTSLFSPVSVGAIELPHRIAAVRAQGHQVLCIARPASRQGKEGGAADREHPDRRNSIRSNAIRSDEAVVAIQWGVAHVGDTILGETRIGIQLQEW